ncbi:MAG TPA: hypothetical protein VMM59_04780 [Thermohalobaculum sp.]|nr:hypothetical protein [Thermohalobaculum sp.]
MLIFRLICAALVAWAVNWVMGQPVAANLLELVPEMGFIVPIAGAMVGFLALATRQGWGVIVAMANGLWTMLLTVAAAWLLFLVVTMMDHVAHGLISNFENFLRILGVEMAPLAEGWVDPRLIGVMLAATVVVGIVTEILHWILVRLRKERGEDEESTETT